MTFIGGLSVRSFVSLNDPAWTVNHGVVGTVGWSVRTFGCPCQGGTETRW